MLAEHKVSCPRSHHAGVGMSAEERERIRGVFAGISYRDWSVRLVEANGAARIQVAAPLLDSETGKPLENFGRPLPLCPRMSDGFLIDLAFELIKEFELHEAAERFGVNGARVYFPHDASGMPLFEVPSLRASDTPERS